MKISCTLDGRELARRRVRWDALGYRREPTADGLRLTFERPDPEELRELVALENECCGWAQWTVAGDAVVVRSRGIGIATLHAMFTSPA